jgi:hypothetical protein
MPASRAIPPRFFLSLVLFVPLALVFLPAPAAPVVSRAEVVSLFDEIDPPAVRSTAVPTPWRDDVFTGSTPSMPWSDDESFRKARVSRVDIREKRPATATGFSWDKEKVPAFALHLLTNSLVLGRPPPPLAPRTG